MDFRDIPGFPGYRGGDDGRVYSCWRRKGNGRNGGPRYAMTSEWRPLAAALDKDGYRRVILCVDGKRLDRRVHNLILLAFVGPRPSGMVGCHRDGNRSNNRPNNLRWDTQASNIADKVRHGTAQRGERSSSAILRADQAAEIRRRRAAGERGVDLAREFGVSTRAVSAIFVGRNWGWL